MSTYKKIVCKKLGTNFAECTEIVAETINDPEATQLRVKITAVGINASDINFTSGRYSAGKAKVPFDCGFEGIGTVSAVGSDLQSKFKVGEAVAVLSSFQTAARFVLRFSAHANLHSSALPQNMEALQNMYTPRQIKYSKFHRWIPVRPGFRARTKNSATRTPTLTLFPLSALNVGHSIYDIDYVGIDGVHCTP